MLVHACMTYARLENLIDVKYANADILYGVRYRHLTLTGFSKFRPKALEWGMQAPTKFRPKELKWGMQAPTKFRTKELEWGMLAPTPQHPPREALLCCYCCAACITYQRRWR